MDVVMLAQHGITQAVGTLGTATTREHVQLLFKSAPKIVFCFDGDRAGRSAAWRALEQVLPEMHEGRECVFMFMPEGEDPDTWVQQVGPDAFRAAIDDAAPLTQFLLENLSKQVNLGSLEGRARLIALARPHLDKLPAGALHMLLVDELGRRARLGRNDIEAMLGTPKAAPAPVAETATQAPTPGAARPVRRAMQLLLEQPSLAESVENIGLLAQASVQGIEILIEAIDFFHAHPDAHAAHLAEAWKDTPKGRGVMRLLSQDLGVGGETVEIEFRDAINLLTFKALESETTRLLEESRHRELTRAELGIIESFHRSRPPKSR
jgi:DNA primase